MQRKDNDWNDQRTTVLNEKETKVFNFFFEKLKKKLFFVDFAVWGKKSIHLGQNEYINYMFKEKLN